MGEHAILRELRQVGGIDDLRVFDPPATIAGETLRDFGDRVERILVRRGADGVDRGLEIALCRAHQYVPQLGGAGQRQAGVARIVGIVLLEPRAATAQRAVEIDLDPVHAQLVVIKPWRRPCPGDQLHLVGPGSIGHDPQRQRALVPRAADRPASPRSWCPCRATAGDAVAVQDLLRFGQCEIAFVGARCGDRPRHQFFRGIDEHARWHLRTGATRSIRPPAAALAAASIPGFHGQRIGPAGMAVDALEIDRAIGHRAIQFGRGRKAPEAPFLLVPAAPEDPRSGFVFGSESGGSCRALPRASVVSDRSSVSAPMPIPMTCACASISPGIITGAFAVLAVIGLRLVVPAVRTCAIVPSSSSITMPVKRFTSPSSPIVSPSTLSISTSPRPASPERAREWKRGI